MIKLLKREYVLRTKKNLYKYLKNRQLFYIQDILESISEGEAVNLKRELAVLDIDWNKKTNGSNKLVENIYCFKNPSQKNSLDMMISKIKLILLEFSISNVDFLFEVKNKWIQKDFATKEFQKIYSELRKYIACSSEFTVFRVNVKKIDLSQIVQ